MAWVATQNFREVDRLLSHSDPVATLHFKQLGADARPLLRYQASEFNRWLFHGWDNAQLIDGSAILFLLLFWSRENKMTLSGILLLLILAAIQRFVLTPEIIGLGRMLDFAPAGALTREHNQFWIAHSAYSGVELAKWCVILVLAGNMVFSRQRSGRSRDSRNQLDRVDKRNHRRVDR